jgi:hypothetical protein
MIKFFRKIRQNLIMENKTGKYFKYAIGEIVLVVIGILIALWINNLNIKNQENKERETLITNIKKELNENLNFINTRQQLLDITNKNLIKVLNFSATSQTDKPIDSLKSYVTKVLTLPTSKLNNSRISSAKTSGKFSLLSDSITTSLTDYETSVNNFMGFRELTTQFFNNDWSNLAIGFNSLERFHKSLYPETNLISHPDLLLDEQKTILFLKEPTLYQLLHKYYTSHMIETAWLIELKSKVESTINTIENEQL